MIKAVEFPCKLDTTYTLAVPIVQISPKNQRPLIPCLRIQVPVDWITEGIRFSKDFKAMVANVLALFGYLCP